MTKTVFAPDMVAHVWASQTQESGRTKPADGTAWGGNHGRCANGSAYFEGPTLYSYGTHYVVGYICEPANGPNGGAVLLNSESSTVTTNRRRSDASGATSHYRTRHFIPLDSEFVRTLQDRSSSRYRRNASGEYVQMSAAEIMREYLAKHILEITPDAADFLASLNNNLGAVARIRAAAIKARDKEQADEKAREKEKRLRDAEQIGSHSWEELKASPDFPRDAAKEARSQDWQIATVEKFSKRLNAALREARAAKRFSKVKLATLKERLAQWRDHKVGMADRIQAAARAELMTQFERWRDFVVTDKARDRQYFQDAGLQPWQFESWAPDVAAQITELRAVRQRETRLAAFAAWDSGQGNRPAANDYPEGSAERVQILESEHLEREGLAALYEAWLNDRTAPRPAARLFSIGELRARYPNAFLDLAAAEREERLAKERADTVEQLRAWLDGESFVLSGVNRTTPDGGAYMRRMGDELETSQGAQVPWAHAVRVFRFIKAVRAKGKGWTRNGHTVRVGHFTIDSISPDGSFRAGCHVINWSEVERLARREGVFDIAESTDAVEASH